MDPQLKGVGVKSVEILGGAQAISTGNSLLRLAVACLQTTTRVLNVG